LESQLGHPGFTFVISQPEFESNATMQINNQNNARVLNVTGIDDLEEQNELAGAIEFDPIKSILKRYWQNCPLKSVITRKEKSRPNEHYKSSPYTIGISVKSEDIYGTRFDIKFNQILIAERSLTCLPGKPGIKNLSLNQWIEFPEISLFNYFR